MSLALKYSYCHKPFHFLHEFLVVPRVQVEQPGGEMVELPLVRYVVHPGIPFNPIHRIFKPELNILLNGKLGRVIIYQACHLMEVNVMDLLQILHTKSDIDDDIKSKILASSDH